MCAYVSNVCPRTGSGKRMAYKNASGGLGGEVVDCSTCHAPLCTSNEVLLDLAEVQAVTFGVGQSGVVVVLQS